MEQSQKTDKPKAQKPASLVKRILLTLVGFVLAGSGGSGMYDELTSDKHLVSMLLNMLIILLGLFLVYRNLIRR